MSNRTSKRKRELILELRREERDMRLVEVAERVGVHVATVSRVEHEAGSPRRNKHRKSFADNATGSVGPSSLQKRRGK